LFRAGDDFSSIYMVRSGCVKSYMISEDGEEQIVAFHRPGEIVGMDSVGRKGYVCSAVSLQTSSICRIPCAMILNGKSDPTSQVRLIMEMAGEIQRLERMLTVERKTAEQRIAEFLLDQSSHNESRGYSPREFNLAMSRKDIGKFTDLATETVSRAFGRLQQLGLIAAERSTIEIIDLDRLRRLANQPAEAVIKARAGNTRTMH
ncbi:MAG: helix-turn-helix domain-containing protein, partial [Gammaproteobacteria bacterium]